MKIKIVAAIIPGLTSGNTIFLNTHNLEAPSTKAASSNSIGIVEKKPLVNHIAYGTFHKV